jgi:outer membrane protein assembly factor BamA
VLSSSPVSQQIAVSVRVDEGRQYRLEKITFKGNKEISNPQALRSLFRLKDGDVFARDAVSQGLETLRFAYLQLATSTLPLFPLHSSTRTSRRLCSR